MGTMNLKVSSNVFNTHRKVYTLYMQISTKGVAAASIQSPSYCSEGNGWRHPPPHPRFQPGSQSMNEVQCLFLPRQGSMHVTFLCVHTQKKVPFCSTGLAPSKVCINTIKSKIQTSLSAFFEGGCEEQLLG